MTCKEDMSFKTFVSITIDKQIIYLLPLYQIVTKRIIKQTDHDWKNSYFDSRYIYLAIYYPIFLWDFEMLNEF